MALTGIQIFKSLPKTNCGECGVPTCLAFAMKLASGKADLSACPYVSEEAKTMLKEASAPPIGVVTIGAGDNALKIGGETVSFRHDKRLYNPPGIAVLISDTADEAEVDGKLERYGKLRYERVGLTLRPELVAIKCDSGDATKFEALVSKVNNNCDCAIILISDNPDVIIAGLKSCADGKPLIYGSNKDNLEQFAAIAEKYKCPIGVKASNLEELVNLSNKLTGAGVKNLVLDSGSRTMKQAFSDQINIRRTALEKKFRPLGFPTITFPCEMTDNPMKEALFASIFIAKYAGIVVLSDLRGESLFPLLVERMNIYTDPQSPLAVTEGIYDIGEPDENSPILITTNFSLTYFIVSGEIEASKIPCRLLIIDTEGLSVLTAWAAGKFVADVIGLFIKKSGVADMVNHRKLIIPGYVAVESGSLEEELPGWEIQIGPREATNITPYLNAWKAQQS
ncbi:MAG: acetyl-CoA decarbonylase/synthase complex subunit gamma [Dehalococcoidia bacterium]|nr:acetyl-CoA decarbonylase/synthase complex subunit gamma [Dehalococcoidia bacterium]